MEKIDHIAIVVNNINRGVDWYTKNRDCKVKYQDSSWALLEFQNVDLALVRDPALPPNLDFLAAAMPAFTAFAYLLTFLLADLFICACTVGLSNAVCICSIGLVACV